MLRRVHTLRVTVLEDAVIQDPRLSIGAVGLYAYLSANPASDCTRAAIAARFVLDAVELQALLTELDVFGYLASEDAVAPLPPPRRRGRRPRRKPWIPATGKLLLRTLADTADADGCARPTNAELVEATGNSSRTIMRNLSILEGAGLVRRETVDNGDKGNLRLIWVSDRQVEPEARS